MNPKPIIPLLVTLSPLVSGEDLLSLDALSSSKVPKVTNHVVNNNTATVYAMTRDEILRTGYRYVSDVLNLIPGIRAPRSDRANGAKIAVRGLSSTWGSQASILLNGMPIRSHGERNSSVSILGMTVDLVERIEVSRGPSNALYGADALGGVINIVLREPKRNESEVAARVGHDILGATVYSSVIDNQYEFNLGVTFEANTVKGPVVEADGQTALDQIFGTKTSLAPGRLANDITSTQIMATAKVGQVSGHVQYLDKVGQLGIGASHALDHDGLIRHERLTSNIAYRDKWGNIEGGVNLFYSLFGASFPHILQVTPVGSLPGFPDGIQGAPSIREEMARIESKWQMDFGRHRFDVGVGAEYIDVFKTQDLNNYNPDGSPRPELTVVEDNDEVWLPEKNRHNVFTFMQGTWALGDDWLLTSGLRFDRDSINGELLSPRLAVVWAASNDLAVKLVAGQGGRVPTISEMYARNNPSSLGQELDAEKIRSAELIFDYQPSFNYHTTLSLYVHRLKDQVVYRAAPSGIVEAMTSEDAMVGYGFEFLQEIRPIPSLLLQYSYALSLVKSGFSQGNYPKHQTSTQAYFDVVDNLQLGILWRYEGTQGRVQGDERDKVDAYHWVDLSGRWRVNSQFTLRSGAQNILNSDCREGSIGPNPRVPGDIPCARFSFYISGVYRF